MTIAVNKTITIAGVLMSSHSEMKAVTNAEWHSLSKVWAS